MTSEVAWVEDVGELGATVLGVRAEIGVQLVEGGEFCGGGGRLVHVGRLARYADFVALGGCGLEKGEEVGC